MEQDYAWKKKKVQKQSFFGEKSIILSKIQNFCNNILKLIYFSKFQFDLCIYVVQVSMY